MVLLRFSKRVASSWNGNRSVLSGASDDTDALRIMTNSLKSNDSKGTSFEATFGSQNTVELGRIDNLLSEPKVEVRRAAMYHAVKFEQLEARILSQGALIGVSWSLSMEPLLYRSSLPIPISGSMSLTTETRASRLQCDKSAPSTDSVFDKEHSLILWLSRSLFRNKINVRSRLRVP